MQKSHVEYQLQEAYEALGAILKELRTDPEYEIGAFTVEMQHLYHHINTAWNAREIPEERASACSEEDFAMWSRFPSDLDPLGS